MSTETERDLEDIGKEPDARFSFANERTFLAWNRTALALVAAGLAAAELLKTDPPGLRLIVAIPLIVLAAVCAVTSYMRWRDNERQMRLGEPLEYTTRMGLVLGLGIGLTAIAAIVLVIVDAAR